MASAQPDSRSSRTATLWLLVGLSVCSLILPTACSSASKTDDPATLVYVGSSDDTWTAAHIVLIELDYDVESENRNEGKIRAIRSAGDDHSASVLTIDQIGRHDTISIYIRAMAAPGQPTMAPDQAERLAQEFLSPFKALLYK